MELMTFQKGNKFAKGNKHTEEWKRKASERMKGNTQGFQKGKPSPRKGKKSSKPSWNKGLKGFLAGEKHYNWKGGTSKGYRTGYYSFEYKKWRIAVFERDSFTCQSCHQVGGYLTAHHIKSFAHYPELRTVLENGITLCEDCHKLTDNYKGRGKKKK